MIDNTLDERPCLFTQQEDHIITQVMLIIVQAKCVVSRYKMYLHIYLCLYFMNQAKCKTNMLGVEHCTRGGEDRMGK